VADIPVGTGAHHGLRPLALNSYGRGKVRVLAEREEEDVERAAEERRREALKPGRHPQSAKAHGVEPHHGEPEEVDQGDHHEEDLVPSLLAGVVDAGHPLHKEVRKFRPRLLGLSRKWCLTGHPIGSLDPRTVVSVLSEIADIASETLELHEVFDRVAASVRRLIPFEYMTVVRIVDGERVVLHATTSPVRIPARSASIFP
jgi:hypothetical protein